MSQVWKSRYVLTAKTMAYRKLRTNRQSIPEEDTNFAEDRELFAVKPNAQHHEINPTRVHLNPEGVSLHPFSGWFNDIHQMNALKFHNELHPYLNLI
jgi:hypothetical protein